MPFDAQPTLLGPTLRLRPLAQGDFEALRAAAADPLIWAQHPDPRHELPNFQRFFEKALASGGALAVCARDDGRVVGTSRYYDHDEAASSITIGFTFLVRRLWGGMANRELKTLMIDHAFGQVRTIWFHVAAGNLRSRRAVEKLGAVLSHTGMTSHADRTQETCYFRLDATAHGERAE